MKLLIELLKHALIDYISSFKTQKSPLVITKRLSFWWYQLGSNQRHKDFQSLPAL